MKATVALERRPRPATELPAPPTGIAILGCGYWGMNYVRVLERAPRLTGGRGLRPAQRPPRRVAPALPRAGGDDRRGQRRELAGSRGGGGRDPRIDALGLGGLGASGRQARARRRSHWPPPSARPRSWSRSPSARAVPPPGGPHVPLQRRRSARCKECLDGGGAGEVYYLYARRTNLGPVRRDVNAIWDLAPHDVAIFNYLLGGLPDVGQRRRRAGARATSARTSASSRSAIPGGTLGAHPRELGRAAQGPRGGRRRQSRPHRLQRPRPDRTRAGVRQGCA